MRSDACIKMYVAEKHQKEASKKHQKEASKRSIKKKHQKKHQKEASKRSIRNGRCISQQEPLIASNEHLHIVKKEENK
jgi:transposase